MVNIMAVDGLDPCVPRPSASITILLMQDAMVFVFLGEDIPLYLPDQSWGMTIIIFMINKMNSELRFIISPEWKLAKPNA